MWECRFVRPTYFGPLSLSSGFGCVSGFCCCWRLACSFYSLKNNQQPSFPVLTIRTSFSFLFFFFFIITSRFFPFLLLSSPTFFYLKWIFFLFSVLLVLPFANHFLIILTADTSLSWLFNFSYLENQHVQAYANALEAARECWKRNKSCCRSSFNVQKHSTTFGSFISLSICVPVIPQ